MNQDNALKRALIPPIKALTKALNAYSTWAATHRKQSNILVGVVMLFGFWGVFIIMLAIIMTPVGLGLFLMFVITGMAYMIGDMING